MVSSWRWWWWWLSNDLRNIFILPIFSCHPLPICTNQPYQTLDEWIIYTLKLVISSIYQHIYALNEFSVLIHWKIITHLPIGSFFFNGIWPFVAFNRDDKFALQIYNQMVLCYDFILCVMTAYTWPERHCHSFWVRFDFF